MARSFGNLRFEGGDKKQPRCDPRMYVGSLGATYVSDQLNSGREEREIERDVYYALWTVQSMIVSLIQVVF